MRVAGPVGPGPAGAVLLAALTVAAAAAPPEPDMAELLRTPPPGSGLVAVEGPTAYGPATLFEVLDGGAPLYLDYGFVSLVRARFRHADAPRDLVTVDVFDMGSPLGAFGVYRSIGPEAAPPRAWGAEGYRSGVLAAAWKGRFYVHGEADAERAPLVAAMEAVVAHVAEGVSGSTALPSVLDVLPVAGRVAGSERWIARDLLGHAFLPGGVVAAYEIDGARTTLFVSDAGTAAAAAAALRRLRAHHARLGAATEPAVVGGTPGFRFAGREGETGVAVAAGSVVAGVRGATGAEAAARLLAALVGRLGGT